MAPRNQVNKLKIGRSLLTAHNPKIYDEEPRSVHDHGIAIINRSLTIATVLSVLSMPSHSRAAAVTETFQSGEVDLSTLVTSKAFLDIRIANYTEEAAGNNRGATGSGRITIGLFGNDAPNAVAYFLRCCRSNGTDYPSYAGAQFTKINDDNVLEMEKVRGVQQVVIAGADNAEYRGKLLMDYNLIAESNRAVSKHFRRGLLTRNRLSKGPQFGITLANSPTPSLDQFNEVFGVVLDGYEVKFCAV